ncbi:MAG: YkgJ family cysteine cluster protein [Desulfosarcina sp.]|nr:YkgJ family cysteine cluster protein [Desulfosarcina sp.]
MIPELDAVFKKYEALVKQVDGVFESVRQQYSDCVNCKLECSDCCHALFDLSLVEALYINRRFLENVAGERKNEILDDANKADRKAFRMKRKAFKAVDAGEKSEEQVLLEMAAERIRCPLLNKENRCDLYESRPVTCRLYGIPTAIAGRGHTCGLSAFKEGESYPTVNLDSVQAKLHELSQEIVAALRSTHVKMGDLLMPLSMALLTVFDESYLGIKTDKKKGPEKKQE